MAFLSQLSLRDVLRQQEGIWVRCVSFEGGKIQGYKLCITITDARAGGLDAELNERLSTTDGTQSLDRRWVTGCG